MDIRIKFGLRVKELRTKNKLSQESFALSAEIDRTYVQSIEKGRRNVSITTIQKIATAFDISIESLLKNL